MNRLLWNLLLALAWVALGGEATPGNFAAGFAVGFVVLLFVRGRQSSPRYAAGAWRVVRLAAFFVKELVVANLRVAYDVLTPGFRARPAVLAVPLDAETDAEITLLANLVTLTPGTLSLDVSADRRTLYVHAMYVDDAEAAKREIKTGFERRVLDVSRGRKSGESGA